MNVSSIREMSATINSAIKANAEYRAANTCERIDNAGWRPLYTTEEIFSIDPNMLGVHFSTAPSNVKAFRIDGTNRQQLLQFGRALALRVVDLWELLDDSESLPGVYQLHQKATGRMLEATVTPDVTKDGTPILYADLFELGDNATWVQHKMVGGNTHWTLRNRHDQSQPVTAYTKYHYLVKLLQGTPINIVTGEIGTSHATDTILDAFYREMWYVCGYDYKSFKSPVQAA